MANFLSGLWRSPEAAILDAFHHSQAIIEFSLNGIILTANENFLKPLGYRLEEVQGKHHHITPTVSGLRAGQIALALCHRRTRAAR